MLKNAGYAAKSIHGNLLIYRNQSIICTKLQCITALLLHQMDIAASYYQQANIKRRIHINTVKPSIVDGARHFEHEDYQAVHRHVERVSNRHKDAESPEPLEPAEFLLDLNRSYMAKAEHPQSDKIRITQEAAKEMLARGDAKVYRLKADGAECLSRLTVVHNGLNFEKERAFAINPSDMAGFDAWAKRTASDMVRQTQERGEQKKNRANEI